MRDSRAFQYDYIINFRIGFIVGALLIIYNKASNIEKNKELLKQLQQGPWGGQIQLYTPHVDDTCLKIPVSARLSAGLDFTKWSDGRDNTDRQ